MVNFDLSVEFGEFVEFYDWFANVVGNLRSNVISFHWSALGWRPAALYLTFILKCRLPGIGYRMAIERTNFTLNAIISGTKSLMPDLSSVFSRFLPNIFIRATFFDYLFLPNEKTATKKENIVISHSLLQHRTLFIWHLNFQYILTFFMCNVSL